MQVIHTIDELKDAAKKGGEFTIRLRGGLRSSKHIYWDEKDKSFYVCHYIDGTDESLSEEEIMDSNIGTAMKCGALLRD